MGSSFAPPVPASPGAPPPAPPPGAGQPPAGISGLVGGVPSQLPTGPTPDQKVQAYMEQIRNLTIAIEALAQQHPEAANDMNDAKNALINSMSKVATAMQSPDQNPQPQTF